MLPLSVPASGVVSRSAAVRLLRRVLSLSRSFSVSTVPAREILPFLIRARSAAATSIRPFWSMVKLAVNSCTGMPLLSMAAGLLLIRLMSPSSAILPPPLRGSTDALKVRLAAGRPAIKALGLMLLPSSLMWPIMSPKSSANGLTRVSACSETSLPMMWVFRTVFSRVPESSRWLSMAMPSSSPLESSVPCRAKGESAVSEKRPWLSAHGVFRLGMSSRCSRWL